MALHDDFMKNWQWRMNAIADGITYSPGSEINWSPQKQNLIVQAYRELVQPGAGVFYFDDMHLTEEFIGTAWEFYQQGFLPMPHERTLFLFRRMALGTIRMGEKMPEGFEAVGGGDTASEKDLLDMGVYVHQKENGALEFIILDMPNGELKAKHFDKQIIRGLPLTTCVLTRETKRDSNFIIQVLDMGADAPEPVKQAVAKISNGCMGLALGCALALGMPQFERREQPITDKLNKARLKSGKPPLQNYTTVHLLRRIQDELGLKQGGGWTVRPHWRRGHIRTLEDGRKVPVKPCLVNFSGDDELQKQVYKVLQ